MKKQLLQILWIVFCVLAVVRFSNAQQLDHISPSQNQHYFTQISFINENEGWAFDEYDHSLYHTINGGKKWEEHYHFTFRIWTLKFADSLNGYISGDDSDFVYITKDGGQHWQPTNLRQQYPFKWYCAYEFTFVDSMNFCFIYHYYKDSLYTTNDGGATWNKKSLPGLATYFSTFFATDSNHFWNMANNTIYHSIDGGNSWITQIHFSTNIVDYGIYFSDSLNGMLLHHTNSPNIVSMIALTHDGGYSWQNTDTLEANTYIRSISFQFLNPANGCISIEYNWNSVLPESDGVYITHDAGYHWSKNKLTDSPRGQFCISTAGSKKYVRGGVLGLLDYSTDSGDTWQSDLEHNPLFIPTAVKFYNHKSGNAVSLSADGMSEFYKTNNGGISWQKTGEWYNSDEHGMSSFIIDPQHYLNFYYNYFRLFRNGGLTNDLISLNGLTCYYIHLNDAKHIWMATDTAIYFSSDTCHTWTYLSHKPVFNLPYTSLYFLNDNLHGWMIQHQYDEKIYSTNDGGLSWNEISIAKKHWVNDLYFTDSLHGWLLDDDVYYTNDGGLTWVLKPIDFKGPDVICTKIKFIDNRHGWLIGGETKEAGKMQHSRQFVAYTNDGGLTWNTIFNKRIGHNSYFYSKPILTDISYADTNHVWIYGQLYEMYKLHYDPETSVPDACPVKVYPNPTRVSFTIDLSCFGEVPKEVFIYDVIGKLVKHYTIGKETGLYETDAHLRDGIYFVSVHSSIKSTSAKLIISRIKKL